MSLFQLLPLLATIGFLIFAGLMASGRSQAVHWGFPAFLAAAFLLFSLIAVAVEGPAGFWPLLSGAYWGNQIAIDLLLAFGICLSFLVPQAREQGMRAGLWVLLVCCTGSIGLLAMQARLIYLRGQQPVPATA